MIAPSVAILRGEPVLQDRRHPLSPRPYGRLAWGQCAILGRSSAATTLCVRSRCRGLQCRASPVFGSSGSIESGGTAPPLYVGAAEPHSWTIAVERVV